MRRDAANETGTQRAVLRPGMVSQTSPGPSLAQSGQGVDDVVHTKTETNKKRNL
jgi:hypothetical protein